MLSFRLVKKMEMNFKYCRIQGKEFASNTKAPKGVFSILNQMVQRGEMEQEDSDLFLEINDWFANVLPWPPQCKRQENVICYFKTENSQMMMKMIIKIIWIN